ncbi:hypothetical protein A2614_00205 [Candidatus Woesebacteria bacterium RIFOXYD1_FULL_40_21]|uniref:DNA-directed DNA polymerase n=1 Tax=Candidatus Woesebacteria bacterium RIFOXYD1_FULL_40_21 TaxID=1802549 RepID=A0A1F8DFV5_9BACT|nr:MAG: hypothetical protein A2614_00205 [Candidatus Woesebacteria bacterium RIFOXYD1_FULL_40_21]
MTNLEIAELLRAVAAAYQLKNADKNKFKIIAYQRAADAVEHASSELKDLWDDKKLEEVPGIGKSIAEHLDELFRTGKSKHFEEVMEGLPPSMFDLMKVPGVGAKTGYKLAKELGIKSLGELEKAAKTGKIKGIPNILKSIEETKGRTRRLLLPYASQIADSLVEWLKTEPSVKEAVALGSLRRKAATVGDIDIAVATNNPQKVMEHFTKYPKAQRVLEKGEASASIIVPGDIQVDLMVQSPDSFGALLQHFTGSKHHNIALREYARSLSPSLSLSEYGIRISEKLRKFTTEEEFYKFLGLDYIPPELREDSGEIEASKDHRLPHLVELKDIKADLQIHSDFDIETSHDLGVSSAEEVVGKANELGYEYIAFTEHNPSKSGHTDSQIIDILKRKREVIDKLNLKLKRKSVKTNDVNSYSRIQKVFNSLEIDIMPDGSLPVPEAGLELLDFALVSIHGSFKMPREQMTKRVLSALAHPKVKIFAHPTARKLNEREGVELNWPEIFDFCKSKSKWLEINSDPMRLDLPDTLVHEAVKFGVKLSMGTDAHHKDNMDFMQFGVSVARRGWATENDIVNTRSLEEFEKMLK